MAGIYILAYYAQEVELGKYIGTLTVLKCIQCTQKSESQQCHHRTSHYPDTIMSTYNSRKWTWVLWPCPRIFSLNINDLGAMAVSSVE